MARSDVQGHAIANEALTRLVAALPEIYQPIYGHPELTKNVSRTCDDRLGYIEAVWEQLALTLGRKPRVLDLGCAQGYISLHLASRGAEVVGIDHCAENIAVCTALATEQPNFQAHFVQASIEKLFELVNLQQIDLVLGLSVFHHMARTHGYEAIAEWLGTLGNHVAACIFELALAQEPVHWASAQPTDERKFLTGFQFTHELARLPTHLSSVKRPLIFASNYLWYLDGLMDRFKTMTRSSHAPPYATCAGTRRYYMSDQRIAKLYSLRDAFPRLNELEISQEAQFLLHPPAEFEPVPQVFSCGVNENEVWIVRERLPGELLFDLIRTGKPYNVQQVILQVLDQLVLLEERGEHHNDVKTWNVLILPDGRATLIDYGSISVSDEAYSWPHNLFSAFWFFVWCVTTHSDWSGQTLPPPYGSYHHLPQPFRRWAKTFEAFPAASWSFRLLRHTFDTALAQEATPVEENAQAVWQTGIEAYLADLTKAVNTLYVAVAENRKGIISVAEKKYFSGLGAHPGGRPSLLQPLPCGRCSVHLDTTMLVVSCLKGAFSMSKGLDLTSAYPASVKEKMLGIVQLKRTIDKGRAKAHGNIGEYHYNCPMDVAVFTFLGLDHEALLKVISQSEDDSAVADYVKPFIEKKTAAEIEAWNKSWLDYGPESGSDGEKYFLELRNSVAPDRTDVTSWADVLDLDERRPVPRRVAA